MASDHIPKILYSLCTQSYIVIRVLQASDVYAPTSAKTLPIWGVVNPRARSIHSCTREESQNKEGPIRVLFHLLREGCYRVALTCSVFLEDRKAYGAGRTIVFRSSATAVPRKGASAADHAQLRKMKEDPIRVLIHLLRTRIGRLFCRDRGRLSIRMRITTPESFAFPEW